MNHWPHSPMHFLDSAGTFMVTAATYRKLPIFRSRARLDFLLNQFRVIAKKYDLRVQAWAIFPNHYHFVAMLSEPAHLARFVKHFHSVTSLEANSLDRTTGRQVWFQYWETRLTFQNSYFARLHYVHENPVHHGIARLASNYPWCSASWFDGKAKPSFRKMVLSFPLDSVT